MAYGTQGHRYLLAEKFGDSPSAEDKYLREDLLELIEKHDGSNKGSAWSILRAALEELGLGSGGA